MNVLRRMMGGRSVVWSAVLASMAVLVPAARADYFEEPKLTASDGTAGGLFGTAVAIDGDAAIVSAIGDDMLAGSAYLLRFDGTAWIEEQKITASDGATGDTFGRSVSISGDVAIVGAPGDDDNGSFSGAAYVYRWDGLVWTEEQKLTPFDGAAFDVFGVAVSISGDVVIVAAPFDDDSGDDSGSAYVFRWNGTTWVEEQKLTASDGAETDIFGASVAISGDVAIAGATGDEDAGFLSGAAYVYRWNGATWVEESKLTASDAAPDDAFGTSVSISGDVAVVGADGDDDNGSASGSAYAYHWNGATWTEEQKLTASDGGVLDRFGRSVSISGDAAVVGAVFNDTKGVDSGAAYVFRYDGSTWVQEQSLAASDGAEDDSFGQSVAISGDHALVGASGDDDKGSDSGSAYVLERATMVGAVGGDQLGRAVANVGDLDGDGYDEVVAGAPSSDRTGANAGEITVYDGRTSLVLFTKTGQQAGDAFGHAVAGAGDVNRDGVPDVVVVRSGAKSRKGRVYVYSGADGRQLHRKTGKHKGDRFGWSVAGGLDVNDDRRDDFVVGAPKNDDGGGSAGKVYIYSGKNGEEIGSLLGEAKGDRFGWSVALLRANGDDFADILVGAPKNDDKDKSAGKAYVYSGKNLDLLESVKGQRKGDQHGYAVAALLNADGRDDFAVGSPFYDAGSNGSAGQIVVYHARNGSTVFKKTGQAAGDRLGESLGDAGDGDGDDRADVIIGVPRHGDAGRMYVRSGRTGATLVTVDGEQAGDKFGQSVAGGFQDADELSDFLIGAPGADLRAPSAGRVHVWRSSDGPLATYEPDEPDETGSLTESPLGTYFPRADWADELVHLLSHWGAGGDDADENGDDRVDVDDLRELLEDR